MVHSGRIVIYHYKEQIQLLCALPHSASEKNIIYVYNYTLAKRFIQVYYSGMEQIQLFVYSSTVQMKKNYY